MKRFLTIVAATAVAAAVTIPALADSGSPADELGTFAACLRTHGIPIPADLEGVAIKEWVGAHQDTAGLEAAFKACDPNPRQGDKADHAAPEQLVACLRAKGLEPPAAPGRAQAVDPRAVQDRRRQGGAERVRLRRRRGEACRRAAARAVTQGAAADKAQASRARKPKAQTTPTT